MATKQNFLVNAVALDGEGEGDCPFQDLGYFVNAVDEPEAKRMMENLFEERGWHAYVLNVMSVADLRQLADKLESGPPDSFEKMEDSF